jgi:CRISPR-associated protein Csx17
MTMHLHILKGCAPVPLANYLKALGILRLVSEQADDQARSWWNGEQFCLLTKLSKEELEAFFLEKYEPTPLVSPWNKGSGFFKASDPGLIPLEKSQADRFGRFRQGIVASRKLSDDVGSADAVVRSIKARTKTNKSFQTEEQRQLLKKSETFLDCLAQIKKELEKPGLSGEEKAKLDANYLVVDSLGKEPEKKQTKAEADKLKNSAGYKQLLALADRRFKKLKETLILNCLRIWRGPHAEWLSAAVVLDESGNPEWPSLLGTGGNDGNLDFTNNFMQQLVELFNTNTEHGDPRRSAAILLDNSIWGEPANMLTASAIGQYQPGAAGGANSSTGFDGGNLVNPWDFVLMMEGTIIFTSQATRRLAPAAVAHASVPFAVSSLAAGFATPGLEKAQRGEQWMPLWDQPAILRDISAMFGEGRVQLGRQTAHRPVDVARSISRLGVARGIGSFVRYGYLERNGQSTLAVPLGRVAVRENPRAYLIDDLAGWMNNLARQARDKNAPNRLIHAERCLADAVFTALTHDYTAERWQAILLAAADVESLQASGTAFEAGPIPLLRPQWIASVNDGSPEVRLALALGSAFAECKNNHHPSDSIRHHWLPLEPGARKFKLSDKRLFNDPRVVATGRDPIRDLVAIIERRLIEASMDGQRRSRLCAMPGCAARLDDLAAFLAGQLDIDLIVGLARTFMAIKWNQWERKYAPSAQRKTTPADVENAAISKGSLTSPSPDETWLALRLCVLPFPLDESHDIPADERIVRLLMAGDATRAIEIARRRLIAVGIRPPFQAGTVNAETAKHWAAAMTFPISQYTARCVAGRLDTRLKLQKGTSHA